MRKGKKISKAASFYFNGNTILALEQLGLFSLIGASFAVIKTSRIESTSAFSFFFQEFA